MSSRMRGRRSMDCASEGKKIDPIHSNPYVWFKVDMSLIVGESACEWRRTYRRVVGRGGATIVEEDTERG